MTIIQSLVEVSLLTDQDSDTFAQHFGGALSSNSQESDSEL
jgi:hypothetical protein